MSLAVFIFWYVPYIFSRLIYIVWMHGRFGQTVGKMLMRVIVVDIGEEKKISYKAAFKRESPYFIMLTLILLFSHYSSPNHDISEPARILLSILGSSYTVWLILEIVTTLFNSKRRALHDFLTNSVVIRTESFDPAQNESEINNPVEEGEIV